MSPSFAFVASFVIAAILTIAAYDLIRDSDWLTKILWMGLIAAASALIVGFAALIVDDQEAQATDCDRVVTIDGTRYLRRTASMLGDWSRR